MQQSKLKDAVNFIEEDMRKEESINMNTLSRMIEYINDAHNCLN